MTTNQQPFSSLFRTPPDTVENPTSNSNIYEYGQDLGVTKEEFEDGIIITSSGLKTSIN